MARIGDTLRPELGRTDYSAFQRGSNFGSSQIGQGIASAGQSIGKGIKERKERQREGKKSIAAATSMVNYLKSANIMDEEQANTALEFLKNPDVPQIERVGASEFLTNKFNQTLATGIASSREKRRQQEYQDTMDSTYTLGDAQKKAKELEAQGKRVSINQSGSGRYTLQIYPGAQEQRPNLSGDLGNLMQTVEAATAGYRASVEAGDDQMAAQYLSVLKAANSQLDQLKDPFGVGLEGTSETEGSGEGMKIDPEKTYVVRDPNGEEFSISGSKVSAAQSQGFEVVSEYNQEPDKDQDPEEIIQSLEDRRSKLEKVFSGFKVPSFTQPSSQGSPGLAPGRPQ